MRLAGHQSCLHAAPVALALMSVMAPPDAAWVSARTAGCVLHGSLTRRALPRSPRWLDACVRRACRHLPPDCQLRRVEAVQRLPVMYFRPDAPAPSTFLRVAPWATYPPCCVKPRAGIVGQALPLLAGLCGLLPRGYRASLGLAANRCLLMWVLRLHLVHAVFFGLGCLLVRPVVKSSKIGHCAWACTATPWLTHRQTRGPSRLPTPPHPPDYDLMARRPPVRAAGAGAGRVDQEGGRGGGQGAGPRRAARERLGLAGRRRVRGRGRAAAALSCGHRPLQRCVMHAYPTLPYPTTPTLFTLPLCYMRPRAGLCSACHVHGEAGRGLQPRTGL